MKILLVGLGAIGGVYGSLLQKNTEVELLVAVDEERKKRYTKQGFRINGEKIDFQYVVPNHLDTPVDLIIFSTKAGELTSACELVKPAVGENTLFISLLNGISSEETLKKYFKPENVLLAICNGLDATRNERELSYHNSGKISFGEAVGTTTSPRVLEIGRIFTDSGISWDTPKDMKQTLWYKFMINVGMNQVTAVTKSPYGVLQQSQYAQNLTRKAMEEVIVLGKLEGIQLTNDMIEDCLQNLVPPLDPLGMTSMTQDILQGRKTEVDLFSGEVLRLSKKHEISSPVNEVLYDLIRILEETF